MTTGIALPNVPVPLSRLVLGTMTFGDTVDRAGAADMLATALEAGITGVDTANGYAGGESERILAELLPAHRDRVVLATKAGIPHPDQAEHAPLSAPGLRAALEGSLKRSRTPTPSPRTRTSWLSSTPATAAATPPSSRPTGSPIRRTSSTVRCRLALPGLRHLCPCATPPASKLRYARLAALASWR